MAAAATATLFLLLLLAAVAVEFPAAAEAVRCSDDDVESRGRPCAKGLLERDTARSPTGLSCLSCTAVADAITNSTPASVGRTIATLQHDCNKTFASKPELATACDALAQAAGGLLQEIGKQVDGLAWDGRALCAALGECTVPCCATKTAPEQVHLSLTGTASEMRVGWTTLEPTATHTVRWGSTTAGLSSAAVGSNTTYYHFGWLGQLHTAVMTGLAPSSRYFYQVGDSAGGWSKVFSVRLRLCLCSLFSNRCSLTLCSLTLTLTLCLCPRLSSSRH